MSYIACYNVYNEREHLPESVASVYDKVDRIIFVDGRYKGFYDDKPAWSTDGTLKWLRDAKNDPDGKFEVITTKKPWKKQAHKRSAYLLGKEGDIYLQIDGHEVVEDFKNFNLVAGVAGYARINLPENAIPISVRQPRIFPHAKGLKYITHAYLITEDKGGGNQKLFLNQAWDQLTILPIDEFTENINPDTYCLTLRHIGEQRTESEQRKKQADTEKQQVHVFDNDHGLGHKVDERVAIDRVTERIHEHYEKLFKQKGWVPMSYKNVRRIVAAHAGLHAKKQQEMKKYRGIKDDNVIPCPEPGCNHEYPHMEMFQHYLDYHKKAMVKN